MDNWKQRIKNAIQVVIPDVLTWGPRQ